MMRYEVKRHTTPCGRQQPAKEVADIAALAAELLAVESRIIAGIAGAGDHEAREYVVCALHAEVEDYAEVIDDMQEQEQAPQLKSAA